MSESDDTNPDGFSTIPHWRSLDYKRAMADILRLSDEEFQRYTIEEIEVMLLDGGMSPPIWNLPEHYFRYNLTFDDRSVQQMCACSAEWPCPKRVS